MAVFLRHFLRRRRLRGPAKGSLGNLINLV